MNIEFRVFKMRKIENIKVKKVVDLCKLMVYHNKSRQEQTTIISRFTDILYFEKQILQMIDFS